MKKGTLGVLAALGGTAIGTLITGHSLNKRILDERELRDKHYALFQMMNQWVKIKQEGKNLSLYFEKQGYKEIAIYGMHFAGETLAEELLESGIIVRYGIDKNADKIYADFDIVTPDSTLEQVDVIVVTAITYFNEIEEMLNKKTDIPIISLEDIVCLV